MIDPKEFAKVQEHVDEICEQMHNITDEDRLENAREGLKTIKPLYPHRKWNGKKRQWEKVYKPYPPKNEYYEWKD